MKNKHSKIVHQKSDYRMKPLRRATARYETRWQRLWKLLDRGLPVPPKDPPFTGLVWPPQADVVARRIAMLYAVRDEVYPA